MQTRRGWIRLLALSASACSGAGTPPPSQPGASSPPTAADLAKPLPDPLPEVAARVNGQAVPMRNVAVAARQVAGVGLKIPDDRKPRAFREGMYKLIVRELLFQEAEARKLAPDPRALERAYDETRVAYKDDKAWAAFLAQQGMDPQAFRAELRIQFTIRSLLDQEAAKMPEPGDAEALTFYQQNPKLFESGERLRASHILVRIPDGMDPDRKAELRTKAEGILARIRTGADFAKLAKEFSEDVGSAGKGGELAVFSRTQMVKPFADAAYALKPGQVSDVVETPYGFHIIKIHERLPSTKTDFEPLKTQVKQHLAQQRREQALDNLVKALKARARIETYL